MHPIDCRCVVCLVDRSSFGTPEAKALRASVTDERAARVVQRARELDAGNAGTDPLAEAIWNASRADEGTISYIGANHVAAAVRTYLTGVLAHVNTVEAAARALFAEEQCDSRQRKDVTGNWERRLSVEDCNEYRSLARAALAAIAGLLDEEAGK